MSDFEAFKLLSKQVDGSQEHHRDLRHLIHFIEEGPADGFVSGSHKEIVGGAFPTSIIWYDSAGAGKKKIVEKTVVYTGAFPTTEVWKMYDLDETLLVTITDTITYSGAFEVSRDRVIS